jgi:hypothetical protein
MVPSRNLRHPRRRDERLSQRPKGEITMEKDWGKLLSEVEALCHVYIGKKAEGEQWDKTCQRLEALDKLVRKIRRQQTKLAA